MERVAITTVDGHVKASRTGYRDYFEAKRQPETFDEWVRSGGGGGASTEAPARDPPTRLVSLASEYWATNCYAGVSPFTPLQVPMDVLVGKSGHDERDARFSIGADRVTFGLDVPHFETIFPWTANVRSAQARHDPSVDRSGRSQDSLRQRRRGLRIRPRRARRPHIDRIGFTFQNVMAANAA